MPIDTEALTNKLMNSICFNFSCAYCLPHLRQDDPPISCRIQIRRKIPSIFLADGQCTTAAMTANKQIHVTDDKTSIQPGIMTKEGFTTYTEIAALAAWLHMASLQTKDEINYFEPKMLIPSTQIPNDISVFCHAIRCAFANPRGALCNVEQSPLAFSTGNKNCTIAFIPYKDNPNLGWQAILYADGRYTDEMMRHIFIEEHRSKIKTNKRTGIKTLSTKE